MLLARFQKAHLEGLARLEAHALQGCTNGAPEVWPLLEGCSQRLRMRPASHTVAAGSAWKLALPGGVLHIQRVQQFHGPVALCTSVPVCRCKIRVAGCS